MTSESSDAEKVTVDASVEARLVDSAVALARRLLETSLAEETRSERRRRARLGRLLADPDGREFVLAMTDEVLRLDRPDVAARRFVELVDEYPTRAFGPIDRALLRLGARLAPVFPRLVMPVVVRRTRAETRGIVLPARDPRFRRHVERRTEDGVRLNVNPLGEAILSDDEADARLDSVLDKIARPDVDYVSVKISAIVANLDVLAFESSVDRVAERLRTLYRAGRDASPITFVNLDMEEYRDVDLTVAAFTRVLDDAEFVAVDAGIVIQAYLPDSHAIAERIGDWATERRRRGGGTVKIRLVKGANLAMETVEAELHGWVEAPYGWKADVDASYKRLLESLLRPEWADAVRVGVASHNLFDVAWAVTLSEHVGARERVEFEMLEGMAPAQARATLETVGDLLMYVPVVSDEDFDASIAYLSRRLDENTQPDNFLRSLFTLVPESAEFRRQEAMFRASVAERATVSTERRRSRLDVPTDSFANAPDSDLTDPGTRAAIATAISSPPTPSVDVTGDPDIVDRALETARGALAQEPSIDTRRRWLDAVADLMESERFDTIALMASTAAKTVRESDPEVSEAIDFCRYYGRAGTAHLADLAERGLDVSHRGVVCVIGPWNFPYAIPTGGIAANLAAGNAVILKPAPETVGVGAHIADQFWRAGVPRERLQLIICEDGPVGEHLVTHPGLDTVVLTGSYETAAMFLDWRPDLRLFAETSGKNALVITASADLDLAIADLVRSAFGHAGQKCSAASLGIVDASLYDDPAFLRRLAAAVRSLRVGPPSDTDTMMTPTIAAPRGPLERALNSLEPGESWLVEPALVPLPDGELAWSPGVRIGVQPGSWFHRTECFGPVLGLIRARDLDHALDIQNATEFGLTGGIHALDPDEVATWIDRVEVGNVYVNRGTTGAIVQRQPFGGWKKSSVGGGAKAGGPGYVQQFASIVDRAGVDSLALARSSYAEAWRSWFSVDHDPTALIAESNVLRYRPLEYVVVVHDGSDETGLELLRHASSITGTRLTDVRIAADGAVDLPTDAVDRIRVLGSTALAAETRRACHRENVPIDEAPPVSDGFVELSRWVREQAVSMTLHRHGRVPATRGGPHPG